MKDPAKEIDIETVERATFFQTIQAWPLNEALDYKGWLSNFEKGQELSVACNILDFFLFYSSQMTTQLFRTAVSNSGYIFKHSFSDWKHEDFRNRCIYSFIPGETPSPTDSGHLFVRMLRDELGVPESRIKNFESLGNLLVLAKEKLPIIFVDDFVGSGNQVEVAWNYKELFYEQTLSQLVNSGNHCAVYAPLVANSIGSKRIKEKCQGLNLVYAHQLGEEYNLFHEKCLCWNGDVNLYKIGVEMILRKSRKEGIPSTNGRSVNDEKGYESQGLALAFNHGAPDAIPAFFYWQSETWTPLIKKTYQR